MSSENSGVRVRVMQAASRLVYRRYWLVIAAAVAVTAFSWWSSRKLDLKLNFVDMLSPDDPAVLAYQGAVKQFGALSFLFVVVDMEDPGRGRAFADDLASRLVEDKDFVPRVFYKAEIDKYLDDALLFLKPEELELLAKTVEDNRDELKRMAADPGLASTLEGVTRVIGGYVARGQIDSVESFDPAMVIGPLREMVRAAKTYAAEGRGDPAALRQTLLSQVMKADRQLPIDPSEPYILSRDKKRMLMLVSSSRPSEDFEWCRAYMEYVEGKISASMKKFPGQPRPLITGNAAVMRDDNRVIRHDMKLTTLVSFSCIMLLFAFSFRNLSSIMMVGVPLAVGILWTMAAGYWVIGHLTPITAIFGAILMGMGIDYAILILSRYTEERHSGRSVKEALDQAMAQSGTGIIAGALATCLAFFSMTRSSFSGGRELGVMAGMGIIIFVIIMTVVLPALLVAWDRSRKSVGPTQKKWDPKFMRLAATAADQYAVPVAAVFTIVVGVMAVIAPRFEFEEISERTSQPGVAVGLVWTPVGGDIVFVEATLMPGNKGLLLTGQLGDVMRESAQTALSYIRSHAKEMGIDPSFFEKHDIHIHVPAGAIPKDGPSAGITMATALASLLTGRCVKPRVAMTGEITLSGRVLPVGGIKEKVLAAHRAGIETVILPSRNKKDLVEDVPEQVRTQMRFVFVDTIDEVLKESLAISTNGAKRTRTRRKAKEAAPVG